MATSDRRSRDPEGGGGRVHAISALVGHFHRKWRSNVTWPRRGLPWWGVPMRNRKLRNIRLKEAFLPAVTSSNITSPQRGFPWKGGVRESSTGRCAIFDQASTVGLPLELKVTWMEVPLGCSLGRPRLSLSAKYPFYWLSAPFPPFYFHCYIIYFNNYISYKSLLLEVLCSTQRVSAFSLWGY